MRVLAYMVYVLLMASLVIILGKAGINPGVWQWWVIILMFMVMFVCGWCYK